MNTYLIPREIGDENRFLFFTTKSLIFTAAFGGVGFALYWTLNLIGKMMKSGELQIVAIVIGVLLAVIGYCLGTFKIPETKIHPFFKNAGGEDVFNILKRVFNFRKRRKIYIYEGR